MSIAIFCAWGRNFTSINEAVNLHVIYFLSVHLTMKMPQVHLLQCHPIYFIVELH